MPKITRDEAIQIAIGAALRHGAVNEYFHPHAWVVDAILNAANDLSPVPMRLTCPVCGDLHVDEGEFATKPHHTHACQICGNVWRPAIVNTVGILFLPGFKNQ